MLKTIQNTIIQIAGRIPSWLAITVCIILILTIAIYDAKRWQAFKEEHNCVVVGKQSGNLSTGIDSKGNVVMISSPNKTGYKCDDGITYWR